MSHTHRGHSRLVAFGTGARTGTPITSQNAKDPRFLVSVPKNENASLTKM